MITSDSEKVFRFKDGTEKKLIDLTYRELISAIKFISTKLDYICDLLDNLESMQESGVEMKPKHIKQLDIYRNQNIKLQEIWEELIKLKANTNKHTVKQ